MVRVCKGWNVGKMPRSILYNFYLNLLVFKFLYISFLGAKVLKNRQRQGAGADGFEAGA
ncbi:hypothetical protein AQUSIP_14380 [Aquicella siphonis]|uniref:Uncharacterized protein n=1 Tax=Aquicella siphonis TaxID=254247 RepID=A0A5E4PIA4_9COXI|nr:hypothetical protein AQUSIP_14380 [Aquicella siphonis]